MECWDRERGGEEKFGDLICRFTRLPWPHVSRRSQLYTRPAGEVSMSGEALKQTVSKCNGYETKVFLINNPCHPNFPAMQSPLVCKKRPGMSGAKICPRCDGRLILGLLLAARTDRAGDKPLDKIQEMRTNPETNWQPSQPLVTSSIQVSNTYVEILFRHAFFRARFNTICIYDTYELHSFIHSSRLISYSPSFSFLSPNLN